MHQEKSGNAVREEEKNHDVTVALCDVTEKRFHLKADVCGRITPFLKKTIDKPTP
jgi:hypothetical protein